MRQFVLPAGYHGEGRLELRGRDFHYLHGVLRLPVGSTFPGIDNAGRQVSVTIVSAGLDCCTVEVAPSPSGGNDLQNPGPRITLFQCLPKGNKMDLIVRQATEARIHRIVPVVSERSIPRITSDERGRQGRWSRVIREALQQSGNLHPPILDPPLPFEAIPGESVGSQARLFFHPSPLAHKTLHEYLLDATDEIALLVGPEGGLSEREVALLVSAGYGAVYLGESILRVETAALYSIAAVQIVLLERDWWKARPRSNA